MTLFMLAALLAAPPLCHVYTCLFALRPQMPHVGMRRGLAIGQRAKNRHSLTMRTYY